MTHTLVRVRPRIMREKGGRGKEGEENGREWGKGTEKTPEGKLRRKETGKGGDTKKEETEKGEKRRVEKGEEKSRERD